MPDLLLLIVLFNVHAVLHTVMCVNCFGLETPVNESCWCNIHVYNQYHKSKYCKQFIVLRPYKRFPFDNLIFERVYFRKETLIHQLHILLYLKSAHNTSIPTLFIVHTGYPQKQLGFVTFISQVFFRHLKHCYRRFCF